MLLRRYNATKEKSSVDMEIAKDNKAENKQDNKVKVANKSKEKDSK